MAAWAPNMAAAGFGLKTGTREGLCTTGTIGTIRGAVAGCNVGLTAEVPGMRAEQSKINKRPR